MYILRASMLECIASIKSKWLNKDDTKSPNDEKFQYNKEIDLLFMPIVQKTSIRFFKRFPTAMCSGKMYIRYFLLSVN